MILLIEEESFQKCLKLLWVAVKTLTTVRRSTTHARRIRAQADEAMTESADHMTRGEGDKTMRGPSEKRDMLKEDTESSSPNNKRRR